jgi:hypothetical protein
MKPEIISAPTGSGGWERAVTRSRGIAWLLVLIADAGLLGWGATAALAPERLPGPGSTPILTAGYEGFTGGSWQQLVTTSPKTAEYTTLLFRMYGVYIVAFSLLAIAIAAYGFRRGEQWTWWALLIGNTVAYPGAMAYDRIVGAIGPFEWSEYLGLAVIYVAFAITFPSRSGRSQRRSHEQAIFATGRANSLR